MEFGKLLQLQLLLMCLGRGIEAFVYSCEEMKYRIINTDFSSSSTYLCVVTQENFENWDQLKMIHMDHRTESLYDVASNTDASSYCDVQPLGPNDFWRFTADESFDLDCTQEFSVILTSDSPSFIIPVKMMQRSSYFGTRVAVVPQTDMYLHKMSCIGDGNINLYTGAGTGEKEERFLLRSWTCRTLPEWIWIFENVITIETDSTVSYDMEYTTELGNGNGGTPIMVSPGDRIAVLTSGRSDDLQNLRGGRVDKENEPHRAYIGIANNVDVTVNMNLTFDTSNGGCAILQQSWGGATPCYRNGAHTEQFNTDYFEIRYYPDSIEPSQVWNSMDNIIIDISIGVETPSITTTAASTTPASIAQTNPYCNCDVDKWGMPIGWNYNDIWVDIIFILDTSEAMGEIPLGDAEALIESIISPDGVQDFLITDTNKPFYSRVGVISMADTATTLYNLNMTKKDTLQGKASIKKGVNEIDVIRAFNAALNMFSDGLNSKPDRANARQVIYYMTDSATNSNLNALNQFKTSQGVIIVNYFLEIGEVELPGLKELASTGYYFINADYASSLQSFCKANCFCNKDKETYAGFKPDPAIKAAGGCYHAAPAGVAFAKAKATCANEGGILAAIHDEEKGVILQQLMSLVSSKDNFWFGYEKSDDGKWSWEDGSSNPYTNWDVHEPSTNPISKCGYTINAPSVPWGAGNCNAAFPYVCQYPPCAVGYKDC